MSHKPFGLICPISKACEILQPRWTIQILTELWSGSTRFNDIHRGVGNISRGLLAKRLKELQALDLVERVHDKAAGTIDYLRTKRAIELEPALNSLAVWAQRNIEADRALCDVNLSLMMWNTRGTIIREELPNQRVVIRFHFGDADTKYDTYWMLVQPGAEVEMCTYDPELDVDLFIETTVVSLGAIVVGRSTIAREIERGSIFLSGDARIARTMDRWLHTSDYASVEGIAMLPDTAGRANGKSGMPEATVESKVGGPWAV
jgi:DNA-binding HxlR family transcriptional regulator